MPELEQDTTPADVAVRKKSTLRLKNKTGEPNSKVLVGVRVAPSFHRRIQTECVRRDMSLQELVVAALKVYFATPVDWDRVDMKFYDDDPDLTKEEANEQNAWSDLWQRYFTRMPKEKIQIIATAMQWDLQMLKSSRRKLARRVGRSSKQKGKR